MIKIILPLAVITGVITAPASADSAPSVAGQLKQCKQISADDKRLACFDRLTASLTESPAHKAQPAPLVSEVAQQPARVTQPASTQQQMAEFGLQRDQQDLLENITASVSEVTKDKRGKLVLTLDNGMVWKQTNSAFFRPQVGDIATVERGALGVFYLGVEESNRRIKVKREQ